MNNKRLARRKEINKKKNFLWLLGLTFGLWILNAVLIYFVDPETVLAIPVFFLLFTLTLLFTFSLILQNTKRAIIISLAVNFFLILRFFGVGNLITLLLVIGIAVAIEIYSSILV